MLRAATLDDLPEILDIYNDAVLHTTAIWNDAVSIWIIAGLGLLIGKRGITQFWWPKMQGKLLDTRRSVISDPSTGIVSVSSILSMWPN